jgi:hypothetical protein
MFFMRIASSLESVFCSPFPLPINFVEHYTLFRRINTEENIIKWRNEDVFLLDF